MVSSPSFPTILRWLIEFRNVSIYWESYYLLIWHLEVSHQFWIYTLKISTERGFQKLVYILFFVTFSMLRAFKNALEGVMLTLSSTFHILTWRFSGIMAVWTSYESRPERILWIILMKGRWTSARGTITCGTDRQTPKLRTHAHQGVHGNTF